MLEGLKENMPKAMALFEEILADAQVNKEAYGNLAGTGCNWSGTL